MLEFDFLGSIYFNRMEDDISVMIQIKYIYVIIYMHKIYRIYKMIL